MIYVNAAIGAGKSSLTKILSEDMGTKAFYEKVDNMPMLKKFYATGADSRLSLAFPLQIAFLNYRYQQLREGLYLAQQGMRNTVYDSSLLSDGLMAGNLYRSGQFPQEEYDLYLDVSKNMQANVSGHPFNGYPDLVVYLGMSFDTMLEHIEERGRGMEELDEDKIEYFHTVWDMYNSWVDSYSSSAIVKIDMDKVDYVHNIEDRVKVLDMIEDKLYSISLLNDVELEELRGKHNNMLSLVTDKQKQEEVDEKEVKNSIFDNIKKSIAPTISLA